MVPSTLHSKEGDDDPLDVIVLGPRWRAALGSPDPHRGPRHARRGELDQKIVAVASNTPFEDVTSIEELDERFPGATKILATWFASYKGPGKTALTGFNGPEKAADSSRRRCRTTPHERRRIAGAERAGCHEPPRRSALPRACGVPPRPRQRRHPQGGRAGDLHVVAMLDWIGTGLSVAGPMTAGVIVTALAAIWYAVVTPGLALAVVPFSVLFLWLGGARPGPGDRRRRGRVDRPAHRPCTLRTQGAGLQDNLVQLLVALPTWRRSSSGRGQAYDLIRPAAATRSRSAICEKPARAPYRPA